jgi:hypothetical protein
MAETVICIPFSRSNFGVDFQIPAFAKLEKLEFEKPRGTPLLIEETSDFAVAAEFNRSLARRSIGSC